MPQQESQQNKAEILDRFKSSLDDFYDSYEVAQDQEDVVQEQQEEQKAPIAATSSPSQLLQLPSGTENNTSPIRLFEADSNSNTLEQAQRLQRAVSAQNPTDQRVVNLNSIPELLQTLQQFGSFQVNGVKYMINIDANEIQSSMNLSQSDAAYVRESQRTDLISLLQAIQSSPGGEQNLIEEELEPDQQSCSSVRSSQQSLLDSDDGDASHRCIVQETPLVKAQPKCDQCNNIVLKCTCSDDKVPSDDDRLETSLDGIVYNPLSTNKANLGELTFRNPMHMNEKPKKSKKILSIELDFEYHTERYANKRRYRDPEARVSHSAAGDNEFISLANYLDYNHPDYELDSNFNKTFVELPPLTQIMFSSIRESQPQLDLELMEEKEELKEEQKEADVDVINLDDSDFDWAELEKLDQQHPQVEEDKQRQETAAVQAVEVEELDLDDPAFDWEALEAECEDTQAVKDTAKVEDHNSSFLQKPPSKLSTSLNKSKASSQSPKVTKREDNNELNLYSDNLFGNEGDTIAGSLETIKKAESQMNIRQVQSRQSLKILQQKVQQLAQVQKTKTDRKDQVDLLFLHASPNQYKQLLQESNPQPGNAGKKQKLKLPALDFRKEKQTIKDALLNSGKRIKLLSKVATKTHFEEAIRKKPLVLHISCHGVKKSERAHMGLMTQSQSEFAGHYLLFENHYGDGDLVSAQQLGEFIQKSSKDFSFSVVFVAACDSESVGRIFESNGAKHVVCVEQGRFVLDKAAIQFTKTFYDLLFNGEQICTAFDQAKRGVSITFTKEEASLFKLLKQHDAKSSCDSLPEYETGDWQCLSEHNQVKCIPAKLEKFRFREKDMSSLLQSLLSQDSDCKIFPILGLYGIGKSALARNTLHYVADRKYFTGGVFYVQMKDVRKTYIVLKLIMEAIISHLELDEDERQSFEKHNYSHEAKVIEFLVNFFNGRHGLKFKRHGHATGTEVKPKNQLYLLCLDNVSSLIERDEHAKEQDFINLLSHLDENCSKLRIIVTSSRSLGFGISQANLRTKPFLLEQLKSNESVKLFLDNCGSNFNWTEIQQLILKDESFAYNECLPSARGLSPPIEMNEQLRVELSNQVKQSVNWPSLLSLHDMFRNLLLGNPTSITMMASVYQNPMIKCSLVQVYESLKKEEKIKVELMDYDYDGRPIPIEVKNIMSINVSAEMSVQLLEDMGHDDTNLLYFLGCLPGGVTKDQLSAMWTTWEPAALKASLKRLKQLSLLERGVEKKVLIPTMLNFVQINLELSSQKDYIQSICAFYNKLLLDSYNQIGKTSAQSSLQLNEDSLARVSSSPARLSIFSNRKSDAAASKRQSLHENLEAMGQHKSIFAELAKELRNIEHCIQFFSDLAIKNQEKTGFVTRIASNQGMCATTTGPGETEEPPKHDGFFLDVDGQSKFESDIDALLMHGQTQVDTSRFVHRNSEKQDILRKLSVRRQTDDAPNARKSDPLVVQKQPHSGIQKQTTRIRVQQTVHSKINKQKSFRVRREGLLEIPEESLKQLADYECKNARKLHRISEESKSRAHSASFGSSSPESNSLCTSSNASDFSLSRDRSLNNYKQIIIDSDIDKSDSESREYPKHGQALVNQEMQRLRDPSSLGVQDLKMPTGSDSQSPSSNNTSQPRSSNSANSGRKSNLTDQGRKTEQTSELTALKNEHSPASSRTKTAARINSIECVDLSLDYTPQEENDSNFSRLFLDASNNMQAPYERRQTFQTKSNDVKGLLETEDKQDVDSEAKKLLLRRMSLRSAKKMKDYGPASDSKSVVTQYFQRETQLLVDQVQQKLQYGVKRKPTMMSTDKTKRQKSKDNSAMSSSLGHSLSLKNAMTSTFWQPMFTEGKFILLCVADAYLTNDFEYSLRISTQNFSSIANTCLFEGNILRFRALASLKLFEHGLEESEEDKQENFTYLTKAIESLENALEIFKAEKELREFDPNHYGVALSVYTLGYTYKTFAPYLCVDGPYEGLCEQEHVKYLIESVKESHQKAKMYFQSAYRAFEKVGHLAGMYLSKKHEYELLPEAIHESAKEPYKQLVSECSKRYFDYCEAQNIENSCHIPREHGPDISLMTEIVQQQHKLHDTTSALFPVEDYEESESLSSSDEDSQYFNVKKTQTGVENWDEKKAKLVKLMNTDTEREKSTYTSAEQKRTKFLRSAQTQSFISSTTIKE